MRMKKKKHGSERLNLLSALMITDIKEFYEKREEIFGNDKPLRIEIGCGKGDFVCGKCEQESEYNYLAIEKIADVCTLAVENYAVKKGLGSLAPNGGWQKPSGEIYRLGEVVPFENEELGNVRFMVGDAKELLVNLPDNAVNAVYVNFCDPWSKKGHTKRRLTYIEFLKMYSRILTPDGKFNFKTDNRPLFDFSLEGVCSITVDPHKMGLAPIPAGGIIFRREEYLDVMAVDSPYLTVKTQSTIVGTRLGASSAATYAIMKYFGREGYSKLAKTLMDNTEFFANALKEIGYEIICEPELNIVAFNHPDMDAHTLAQKLEELDWKVSVAKCPVAIRVVLMNHIKRKHLEELLEDLKEIF